MKRTIEIDDTLQERVNSAIEEVEACLREYLISNPETDALPCLHDDLDYSGAVHEIIDSSVPVYTYEIKGLWFLYQSELEEAYEQAGIGDNPMENDGMAAIYCYIEQQVTQWYEREAESIFDDWLDAQPLEED